MTRKSFYRALRKIADKFTWKVTGWGEIRGSRNGHNFCPITAVYYERNNEGYMSLGDYYRCASEMGLPDEDALTIMTCADSENRDLVGSEQLVRKAILRNLKLQKEKG